MRKEMQKKPGVGFWIAVCGMPLVLYLLWFGPACWMNERGQQLGLMNVSVLYRPVLALSSAGRLPSLVAWYACVGARAGADPVVENGQLGWANYPSAYKMLGPTLSPTGMAPAATPDATAESN